MPGGRRTRETARESGVAKCRQLELVCVHAAGTNLEMKRLRRLACGSTVSQDSLLHMSFLIPNHFSSLFGVVITRRTVISFNDSDSVLPSGSLRCLTRQPG